jgi:hypothetical protein
VAGEQLTLQGRIRAKRLLDALPDRIEEGEQLRHLATSSSGLVAATDRRLIVLESATEAHSIPYERIISFAAAKERRKPFMQIRTDAFELVVKGFSSGFEEICRLVHGRLWDVSLERVAESATVEPLRRAAGAA